MIIKKPQAISLTAIRPRARTNLLKDYEKKNAHNAHNAHKCSFIGFDWVFLLTIGVYLVTVKTEKRRATYQANSPS
jgi:hypothetical protein